MGERVGRSSRSCSFGPTSGISRSSKRVMNALSPPGATTKAPLPRPSSAAPSSSGAPRGFPLCGLASSTASLATTRVVPPPIDTVSPVDSATARRMRCAVAASGSPP